MKAIKACPFCGMTPKMYLEKGYWKIKCYNIDCPGKLTGSLNPTDIITAWNTRLKPQSKQPDKISFIEKEAVAYEQGSMMYSDSEVEIGFFEDNIVLCDYSASHEAAVPVKTLCKTGDVDRDELEDLCNRHNWYCVF